MFPVGKFLTILVGNGVLFIGIGWFLGFLDDDHNLFSENFCNFGLDKGILGGVGEMISIGHPYSSILIYIPVPFSIHF